MNTPTPTPRPALKATGMRRRHARCLETELAAAKAECERIKVIATEQNDIAEQHRREIARLRADLERFTGHGLLDCHAICDQRDAAVAERDQLRAEVREARRAWLGDDYGHLPLIEALEKFRSDSDAKSDRADVLYQRACEVEHALRAENDEMRVQIEAHKGGSCQCADDEACAHVRRAERAEAALAGAKVERETVAEGSLRSLESYIDKLKQFAERAEKAEAALAEWSVLNLWGGTPEIIHEFIKGQQNRIHHCQDLEAECLEQARLLGMSGEREADLLGKLERAKADTARLDWLERRNNIAIDHSTWAEHMPLAGQPIIHLLEMDDDCEISLEKIAAAPNLRAAIDVAMIP